MLLLLSVLQEGLQEQGVCTRTSIQEKGQRHRLLEHAISTRLVVRSMRDNKSVEIIGRSRWE